METLIFLALALFVAAPVTAGLFGLFFDFNEARQGKQKKVLTYIAIATSIILWIIAFQTISYGIFSSVESFVLFVFEVFLSGALFVNWITAVVGYYKRNDWESRISKALNGQLAIDLTKYLPSDSPYYSINDTQGNLAIYFISFNEKKALTFQSLGYEDPPAIYADIICLWIQQNILQDKNSYKLEKITERIESWEGGTSDYIETRRTSTGYESHRVSGDPGTRTTTTITHGYKLVHKEYKANKQNKTLTKW